MAKAPKRLRRQGRTPPDSTVALRARLKTDSAAGSLHDATVYVRWLVEQNPELGLLTAKRVVWRELRPYKGSAASSTEAVPDPLTFHAENGVNRPSRQESSEEQP